MKKRIFRDMSIVILLTAVLLSVLSAAFFQSRFSTQIKDGLKTLRVTIIDVEGEVVFDNQKAGLENHKNRPEILEATLKGSGESQRFSETLNQTTYYYAIKLSDNRILRLALTSQSVYSWLYGLIPILILSIIIVFTLCLLLAKRLTGNLVSPINTIDLENISSLPYNELAPFVKKIESQKNEIKKQIEKLENTANTIKNINDNMKEGLILVDRQGVIITKNKSIDDIFENEDILGKNILHLSRNIEFLDKAKKALNGKRSEMNFEQKSKIYAVYFSPAIYENEARGAIILFLDISHRYMAEKQRREFSANVSHELKTPLTTISALSEMMAGGIVKPDDIVSFSEKINAQASRLLYLINDIIRLSEFDEGVCENEFEIFNVSNQAKTIMESFADFAKQKNISLKFIGEDINLRANKRMIDELVFNLIDNAIKYNRQDGSVEIKLSLENKFVKIKISDTGIGINEKYHERIFERFYRVDKSRSKKTGGTGLGLSIVKHITQIHNGKINIKSELGKGTSIEVFLENRL